jgi:hypothetical protein
MVQLTSWQHAPGSITEVPAGESILQVQVLQWDPKGDLPAYLAQRRSAWEASGIQILSELQRALPGIGEAMEYTVQGTDGGQGYFLIAALGDQYLTASGSGDLTRLAEIARTLRVE